jgi:hypothetical protein
MFSALLDVAIGLILLYLILSILASALNEILSNLFQWRSAFLVNFLERLLEDPELIRTFFQDTPLALHLELPSPATTGSTTPVTVPQRVRAGVMGFRNRLALLREMPSYIKAEDFAQSIFDMMRAIRNAQTGEQSARGLSLEEWKSVVINAKMPANLRNVLTSALDKAQDDISTTSSELDKVRKNLEDWYDRSMDRVSGWYKRRTQFALFFIGLALSVIFNLDTISIANRLLQNPALREAIAAQAQAEAQHLSASAPNFVLTPTAVLTPQPGATPEAPTPAAVATAQPGNVEVVRQNVNIVHDLQDELNQLNIPLGWPDPNMPDPSQGVQLMWWVTKALGLFITTLAVYQGAPFWFDLLNRITNLRSAGKPPERAGEG